MSITMGPVCKESARFPTNAPPYCNCVGGGCARKQGETPKPYVAKARASDGTQSLQEENR